MMRVLLDECVPRMLARSLCELGIDCDPFPETWKQVSDRTLLERTDREGYAMLLTSDKNLPWQQTLSNKPFGLIVLPTNNWPKLKILAPKIADIIRSMDPSAKLQVDVDGSVSTLAKHSMN